MDTRAFHAAVLSGLLTVAAGARPGQLLELRTPSLSVTATATEDTVTGPNVQLQYTESLVRGWAFGREVLLTVERGELITGFVGEGPVRLDIDRAGDTLEALGVFAGRAGQLRLSEAELSGTLAGCQFALTNTGRRYVGWRTCGLASPHEPVFLELPPVLERGWELDLAGMLAVLLTSSAPGEPLMQ